MNEQLRKALNNEGNNPEHVIAKGLADGTLWVVNKWSVNPGGLRWLTKEDLAFLGEEDSPEFKGCWAMGTGFVAIR